jgi:hypothetical protein
VASIVHLVDAFHIGARTFASCTTGPYYGWADQVRPAQARSASTCPANAASGVRISFRRTDARPESGLRMQRRPNSRDEGPRKTLG